MRGCVALAALLLIFFGLSACGLFRFEKREAWRDEAENACLSQKLVQSSAYMSTSSAIDGPGTCGMNYPYKITAFGNGGVALPQKATLACPIIPNIEAWLREVVQPAAALYLNASVVELKAGSYACRSRNHQRGAKLSEHSFGNALDIMGFRLSDGRDLSVLRGWNGAPMDQEFMREVFVGACEYFATVLAPGSDMFHYNHIHIDLARHDPRGKRRICKPVIKFSPRLNDPTAIAQFQQRQPMMQSPDSQDRPSGAGPLVRPIESEKSSDVDENEGIVDDSEPASGNNAPVGVEQLKKYDLVTPTMTRADVTRVSPKPFASAPAPPGSVTSAPIISGGTQQYQETAPVKLPPQPLSSFQNAPIRPPQGLTHHIY